MINFGVNQRRYIRNHSVFKCSTHAEMDLLRKIGDKAKGSKLFIYRFNNSTCPTARENKNGKPCILCQHVLREHGVSKVIYVDSQGTVNSLKNRDMIQLIGQPSKITSRFLERFGENHHGKFIVQEYVATKS